MKSPIEDQRECASVLQISKEQVDAAKVEEVSDSRYESFAVAEKRLHGSNREMLQHAEI